MYSALIKNYSRVLASPLFNSIVFSHLPSSFKSSKFCIFLAPTWITSTSLNKSKCENKVLIGEKLTVGIVTKPFRFEGANRRKQAEAGIASLSDKVDSLIIIPNDRLKYVTDQKITFSADVLKQAVSAICGCTTFQKTSSDERGMPDAKN